MNVLNGKVYSEDGTVRYFLNNKLHREHGLALIYSNGSEKNGV